MHNMATVLNVTDEESSNFTHPGFFLGEPSEFLLGKHPWFSVIVLAVNSIMGTIGNSVVIIVNGQKRSKNSTDIFILELSCLDALVSTLYMPTSLYELLTNDPSTVVCVIDKGGAFAYVTISYWMFFSIALDRVIAVTLPYKYKTIMRPSRAKIMASISIVLGICISLPISFSCFTESTADDRKRLNDFMRIYSAWVIFLSIFLAGAYIKTFLVASKSMRPKGRRPGQEVVSMNLRPQNSDPKQVTTSNGTPPSDCPAHSKPIYNLLVEINRDEGPTRVRSKISAQERVSQRRDTVETQLDTHSSANRSSPELDSVGIDGSKPELNGVNGKKKLVGIRMCRRMVVRNGDFFDDNGLKVDLQKETRLAPRSEEEMTNFDGMRRRRALRNQWQIAVTLFMVTFVFCACHLPSAILDLNSWGLSIQLDVSLKWRELIFSIFWFSVPANPVIYAYTSPRFRKETKFLMQRLRSCESNNVL